MLVLCARACEQVLGGARPVRRSVLGGFRNNEWRALGARVLVGALVPVGANWKHLGRRVQVRLGASLDASKWRQPPNGHCPDLTHCNGRCKKIAANRIFKGENVDDGSELDHLTPGVLYYCLESTSKQKFHCASSSFEVLKEHIDINWPAHPLADVFYLTGSDGNGPGGSTGLTLVDITGGSRSSAVAKKRGNLASWIEAQNDAINELVDAVDAVDKDRSIAVLLDELKLSSYLSRFEEQGWDDVDQISRLDRDGLVNLCRDVGLAQKPGHQARFIEHFREREREREREQERPKQPFVVRGVILAPFVTRYKAETATKGGVDVIFGADAFALLGGLQEVVYRPSIGGED